MFGGVRGFLESLRWEAILPVAGAGFLLVWIGSNLVSGIVFAAVFLLSVLGPNYLACQTRFELIGKKISSHWSGFLVVLLAFLLVGCFQILSGILPGLCSAVLPLGVLGACGLHSFRLLSSEVKGGRGQSGFHAALVLIGGSLVVNLNSDLAGALLVWVLACLTVFVLSFLSWIYSKLSEAALIKRLAGYECDVLVISALVLLAVINSPFVVLDWVGMALPVAAMAGLVFAAPLTRGYREYLGVLLLLGSLSLDSSPSVFYATTLAAVSFGAVLLSRLVSGNIGEMATEPRAISGDTEGLQECSCQLRGSAGLMLVISAAISLGSMVFIVPEISGANTFAIVLFGVLVGCGGLASWCSGIRMLSGFGDGGKTGGPAAGHSSPLLGKALIYWIQLPVLLVFFGWNWSLAAAGSVLWGGVAAALALSSGYFAWTENRQIELDAVVSGLLVNSAVLLLLVVYSNA